MILNFKILITIRNVRMKAKAEIKVLMKINQKKSKHESK